ncbi:MAG TPA: hypothetical protein VEK84_04150 [Terriglobales bacterium]|nr:hypothetical protein [Terriglobales bacterium]
MRRLLTLICLLFLSASGLSAQPTIFENVKIRRHRSADKRVLVDKVGTLTFDDSTRKVLFKSDAGDRIDVGYDDIGKVVFEVTTHMREGAFSEVIKGVGLPGLVAGSVVASTHVKDYWFYLDYKDHDRSESVLIDVPKSSSAQVINKAQSVFGPRVTVTDFPEKGAEVKVEDLKALKSKHVLKVDKQSHPLPDVKPEKATVVVVCPPLAARFTGKGIQFKLHANDQVIAVNKMGTYSFAYLDPGKYRLVSQAENANGFEMELEGGHEYFFLQNTFQQTLTPNKTALSRNSPELATYLLEGSYFSDWKPKEK